MQLFKLKYLGVVVPKKPSIQKRRLGNQNNAKEKQTNDNDAIKTTVFSQDDVRENHDKNGRTKNNSGSVPNR